MDKQSELAGLGALINALGGGGDTGSAFPKSDADDFAKGARFIPDEVTVARRRGEKVEFIRQCSMNCWYWKMPDSSRIYHFDMATYRQIGIKNNRKEKLGGHGAFEGGAGSCPECGNEHTNGGVVPVK